MATINKFEDLESWKKARELNIMIWKLIEDKKFKNLYRFQDQITSSVGSIMDNIAEGFERGSNNEFISFLAYAKGSCGEFRSQLHRANDMNFINENEYKIMIKLSEEINGKLQNLISYLNKSNIKGDRFLNRVSKK